MGFQAALAAHPPNGFSSASTVRIRGAPWAGQAAYEDWYLVHDMTALGTLNAAAVSGPRLEPHNAVARLAAGGTAGLYGLRLGAPLASPLHSAWFGKPPGMRYPALFELVGPLVTDAGGGFWMRPMVLGPTP